MTRFRPSVLTFAKFAAVATLFSAVVLGMSVEGAQAQTTVKVDEFSVLRFTPAPGPGNYLSTDGTVLAGHVMPSIGLFVDYAHRPFVLYNAVCDYMDPTNCDTTGTDTALVKYTIVGNLTMSLALWERLQIGLVIPIAYSSGDSFQYTNPSDNSIIAVSGGSQAGLGDPNLSFKFRILGNGRKGFGLGAALNVTAPIGQEIAAGHFIGEKTVTFGGKAIAGVHLGRLHILGNLGGIFRPTQDLFSTTVGSGLLYSVAAGYDLTELFTVLVEAQGASTFKKDTDENPLEARVAAELQQGDFKFTIGGGIGVLAGVGVPAFRLLAGALWAPVRADTDSDGVLDADDACPSDPEDKDGYQDDDGCPESDNDNDGRLDKDDPCPNDPEDKDGVQDEDGCPDTDNDKDGIADGYDSCPNEAEDMDGDRDDDGCPDNDRDKDGIPDATDKCPDQPEDTDGFGDEDGCPETDFDLDGIADDKDECPDQPEIINGVKDKDGCPEPDQDGDGIPDDADKCPAEAETMNGTKDDDGCPDGNELARVEGEQIVILQQVRFATNSAKLVGKDSRQVLDAVAGILARNPSYAKLRVEGHTDNAGDADKNRLLSQKRAQACIDYLARKGISRSRLSAVGMGPDKPIVTNDTEEGRAANRRVEFHIANEPQ